MEKSKILSLEKGKIPPQAVDLEVSVLGACMIDKKGVDDLMKAFTEPNVFYKEAHKLIFSAIFALYSDNEPVDILTVSEKLRQMNKLDLAGGDFYIIELTQIVSSSAHQDFHARVLLQKYLKREMIRVSNQIIEGAYDNTIDCFDLMDSAVAKYDKLNRLVSNGYTSMTWKQAIEAIPKRVEFLTNNQGKVTGLPTGLNAIDKHLSGWQPTDFIVIGADSGMGKTALTLNAMIAAAKEGNPVGMFSMEMSVIQLAIRAIATESNYHLNQLMRNGFEKPEYFTGLLEVCSAVKDYPIYIDDQPALTVIEMKRKARQMYREHKIKLLVIDFVQMFSGDKDIRLNISEAARECKNLAKELDIPVIALSQLSREVRKSNYSIPSKHHLKESSAIEEAADVIGLLYRPGYYINRESNPDKYNEVCNELQLQGDENACLIFAKNRNGAVGNVGLKFIENKTKFVNPTQPPF